MSDIAITVDNVGKMYRLGARQEASKTFREAMIDLVQAPFHRLRRLGHEFPPEETFWALQGVSFEVRWGEVVGIIGRNGAGKSTLLKILSHITEPTEGQARLGGRVGSLLEVGTGFHPELTGRENIFLNGAILGMSRAEIHRKFDEIVAFAEVEKFLDTPVKRYSSGMHVRLAFAVAAHLEPEILVVDEVLAVGDVAFQKKCLGKMEDVAAGGRTVLFVSHNMPAVKALCERGILLQAGRVTCEGNVHQVVETYLVAGTEMSTTGIIPADIPRLGMGEVRVRQIELLDLEANPVSQIYLGQPFQVVLTLEVLKHVNDAVIGIGISSHDGFLIATAYSVDGDQPSWTLSEGWYTVCLELNVTLLPRNYTFDIFIHHSNGADIDIVQRTLDFTALNVACDSNDSYRWRKVYGFIRPHGYWHKPVKDVRVS
jgi:lipopolysaccharide transport system ATP-binding protein